jgi:hypothetical protein
MKLITREGVDLSELALFANELHLLDQRAAEVRRARDLAIIRKREEGATATEIAAAAETTEGRVRQIVKAGPNAYEGTLNFEPARIVFDSDSQPCYAVVLRATEDGEFLEEFPL